MSEVTEILKRAQAGDPNASEKLFSLVYDELRRVAAAKMAREAHGQTLQPTALVHEAWLRLGGDDQPLWQNRAHFFGAAAEAMRRILIDAARRRSRRKAGSDLRRVALEHLDLAQSADDDTLLATSEALDKLALVDPVGAQLIKLRFFVGLSNAEAAKVLGLAERTAKRAWTYARAWLRAELTREN